MPKKKKQHCDSSDDAYKARVSRITDPVELLDEWVSARNLGWLSDPYYRDLVDALADQSEVVRWKDKAARV